MILFGVEKEITTKFLQSKLWKACTMIFQVKGRLLPYSNGKSPNMIERGIPDVDRSWTKCYNRSTEWQDAFRDGLERTNYPKRIYPMGLDTQERKKTTYSTGTEVEHTIAHGLYTLFVVDTPVEDILYKAIRHKVQQIHFWY